MTNVKVIGIQPIGEVSFYCYVMDINNYTVIKMEASKLYELVVSGKVSLNHDLNCYASIDNGDIRFKDCNKIEKYFNLSQKPFIDIQNYTDKRIVIDVTNAMYKNYSVFSIYNNPKLMGLGKSDGQEVYLGYNTKTDEFLLGFDVFGTYGPNYSGALLRHIKFDGIRFKGIANERQSTLFYGNGGIFYTKIDKNPNIINIRLD